LFAGQRIDVPLERLEYLLGQRIQLLGTIQSQGRDATLIVPQYQLAH
jgi:hypothetical protein